jgi:hypothetical protein
MRLPITYVQYITTDVPTEPHLVEQSWLISGASSHCDLKDYIFVAPGITKDPTFRTSHPHYLGI